MSKLKTIIAVLLYLASALSLLLGYTATLRVLHSYGVQHPASFGGRVPMFTATTLDYMTHSGWLYGGTAILSLLLLIIALRKAATPESKRYWIAILGTINFYVSWFLSAIILQGFFLLPKEAIGS